MEASSRVSAKDLARSALKIANLAAWLIPRLPVLQQEEDSGDAEMDFMASQDTAGQLALLPETQKMTGTSKKSCKVMLSNKA